MDKAGWGGYMWHLSPMHGARPMKSPTKLLTKALCATAFLTLTGLAAPSFADDSSLKEGAREVGKAVGTAAREVGQGAKKVGKAVGAAAKEGVEAVKEGAKEAKKAMQPEK